MDSTSRLMILFCIVRICLSSSFLVQNRMVDGFLSWLHFAAKPHHSSIYITQSYTIGRAVDCYFLLHSPNNLSLRLVALSISSLINPRVKGAIFLRFNCFCLLSIYSPNICLRNSCSAMFNVIIMSAWALALVGQRPTLSSAYSSSVNSFQCLPT